MAGIKLKSGDTYLVNVDEFCVDTEDEINELPTITVNGKSSWCNYTSPFGSTAFVVSTGAFFILGSNGWTKLGYKYVTSNSPNEVNNIETVQEEV